MSCATGAGIALLIGFSAWRTLIRSDPAMGIEYCDRVLVLTPEQTMAARDDEVL